MSGAMNGSGAGCPGRNGWGEALFTGLRRAAGVDLAGLRKRHAVDPLDTYRERLHDVLAAGLLQVHGGALRLTERGALLSNEVFRAFV